MLFCRQLKTFLKLKIFVGLLDHLRAPPQPSRLSFGAFLVDIVRSTNLLTYLLTYLLARLELAR